MDLFFLTVLSIVMSFFFGIMYLTREDQETPLYHQFREFFGYEEEGEWKAKQKRKSAAAK